MKPLAPPTSSLWKTGLSLLAGALAVFALITAFVTWTVRTGIHREIEDRDARAIYALARLELATMAGYFENAWDESELHEYIQWEALLSTADYPGILGVQLLSSEGSLVSSVPDSFTGLGLEAEIIALARSQPTARYLGIKPLADHLHNGTGARVIPLLEVVIPLEAGENGEILGLARYLIDGEGIRAALAAVDRQLIRQAGAAFTGGGLILSLLLLFSFFRLQKAAELVENRSRALIRANADLSLAVKTNALGGITAHLIHDLKNPLAGIRSLVEEATAQPDRPLDPEDLDYARTALKRMDALVQDITQLLREEKQNLSYPLELAEFRDALLHKVQPMARERGVIFLAGEPPTGSIDSGRANLLLLILYNLSQNAIEVTPPALAVTLEFERQGGHLEMVLSDQGPGIPEELRECLFDAGRTRKAEGSGLGLAISRQLAYHIEAELQLLRTGPDGTSFRINIDLNPSKTRIPLQDPTPLPA